MAKSHKNRRMADNLRGENQSLREQVEYLKKELKLLLQGIEYVRRLGEGGDDIGAEELRAKLALMLREKTHLGVDIYVESATLRQVISSYLDVDGSRGDRDFSRYEGIQAQLETLLSRPEVPRPELPESKAVEQLQKQREQVSAVLEPLLPELQSVITLLQRRPEGR